MQATYTKLKSGEWGIKVHSVSVRSGVNVLVSKKSGESVSEVIKSVLWKGDGIAICSINKAFSSPLASRGAGGGYHRKACVTDGNCSSIGSGRSCGGHDCDGY